jgi:hypothetical protein
MREISLDQAEQLCKQNGWEITDIFRPENNGEWSIRARDGTTRIRIDDPSNINNILVTDRVTVSTVEEYDEIVSIVEEHDHLWQTPVSDGDDFEKAMAGNKDSIEMDEREVAQRLENKGESFRVSLLITTKSSDCSMNDIPDFVETVQSVKNRKGLKL